MKKLYKLYYCLARPFFGLFYRIKPINASVVPEGPALICPNHSAYSDILLLAYAAGIKRYFRFVAKKELFIPIFGWFLKKIGTISIERGASDIRAIRQIISALKEGHNVALFPEGTRKPESEAEPAKTGAVMIALRSGVTVIPVYIPREKRLFSRVPVVFGEPYKMTRGEGGYQMLANELMLKIEQLKEQI